MKINTTQQAIEEVLTRGVEAVYPSKIAFEQVLRAGKPLKLYLGLDPTGPTLHVGHMIAIRKLAQFQKLGHKVILLIGDFTAQIGDPTDKLALRKPLTHQQALANAKLYKKQAAKFLDFHSKSNPAALRYNTTWLAKMTLKDFISLASHCTVQRLLERDMFQRRMDEGKPIHLNEFLYPVLQGYDSVSLKVDVEVCGNDQTFNALVGRDFSRSLADREKYVVVCKLLTDAEGKKMGKTEGNMIAMTDSAQEMYGKVMALPDELMWSHFELLTDIALQEIHEMKKDRDDGMNPRDIKMRLAREMVVSYKGQALAKQAEEEFVRMFQKKEAPLRVPVFHLKKLDLLSDGKITCFELFFHAGLLKSKSELRRLLLQKGVKVNGQDIPSPDNDYQHQDEFLLQKGKRHFARVLLE